MPEGIAPDSAPSVQRVRFPPLDLDASPPVSPGNIGLLLDVKVRLSVELGRTLMSIREVLSLGPGSVVELDKLAGEPVDVWVNDRLVAKGEVVVVDENFGVRIIEIVAPSKRMVATE